jgi:hypothetical protein
MTKTGLFTLALAFALISCSGSKTEESQDSSEIQETEINQATSVSNNSGTSGIIDAYLAVKDALVADNSSDATEKSKALTEALKAYDIASSQGEDIEELERVQTEAAQFASNIASDDIAVQRESFQALSVLMKDFLRIAGADRTLYHQYCPMYKNNTGGMWLSASSDIKNPLFGSSMLNCGAVEDTLTVNL